jgi:hypothetical protein
VFAVGRAVLTLPVDNIYVGHSTADAESLAKETYHVKKAIEKEAEGSLDDEDNESISILDKVQLKVYEFIRPFDCASKLATLTRSRPLRF